MPLKVNTLNGPQKGPSLNLPTCTFGADRRPTVNGESSLAVDAHALDSRESGQYLGERCFLTSLTPRALLTPRFDATSV